MHILYIYIYTFIGAICACGIEVKTLIKILKSWVDVQTLSRRKTFSYLITSKLVY